MNNNDKWALITTYKALTPAEINFQFMETFRPVGEHKTPRRQTFYDDSLKEFWVNK
tara:strand:- start:676 stop:843 length:168 start_codon:yes stop_codon:yes gene_type:complete